ncbi:MAG: S9 family peptidase [Actinomycetota bacterium]|nr:S9 family peptidase [Actinomycetota bacterium]
MKPEDIGRIVTVSSPAVAPDGRLVAYVVTRVDLEVNDYRSAVWLVATDGSGAPWQLTSGAARDAVPVWSPDGRRIAFASDRGEGARRYGVHVVPVATGGETVTLVRRDEACSGLSWSPDGRHLAFSSRVRDERYAEEDERARPPRRVDALFPRLDAVGWTIDRPTHVFVVNADGSAAPRQLTHGRWEHGEVTWSPDSARVAFVAARHADADLDVVNDLWSVEVADRSGGDPVRLTRTNGYLSHPSWSPDGRWVAVLRTEGRIGHRHARLALVAADGGNEVRTLTASLDLHCSPYPFVRQPVWQGEDVLFSLEDSGRVHLYRAAAAAGGGAGRAGGGDVAVERVVDGARWVTGYDARSGVIALTSAGATAPSEVFVVADGGEERRLTRHQDDFLAACPPVEPVRFEARSEDGCPLDAWLVRPAGMTDGARVPVVLSVHGGPHTQYGEIWFDEFQVFAAAGFAVVYANPHGSTGGGERFARAILSPRSSEDPGTGWGGIDYRDLMTVLDTALERFPELDATRAAIVGGSYGGYMTSWAIGHTDRFNAAVSERAVNNLLSLEWSSDAAGYFRHEMGVSHLDAPEEYTRMSPVTYVRDITTPVLILHSEDDLRCHIEQADCLWVALRLLRRDVDYYRFPAEGHELSRSGSPKHRVQRATLILDYLRARLRLEDPRRRQPEAAWVAALARAGSDGSASGGGSPGPGLA